MAQAAPSRTKINTEQTQAAPGQTSRRPRLLRRVHHNPAPQLNHRTARITDGCCLRGHDGSLRLRAACTVPVIRRADVTGLFTCCVVARRLSCRLPSMIIMSAIRKRVPTSAIWLSRPPSVKQLAQVVVSQPPGQCAAAVEHAVEQLTLARLQQAYLLLHRVPGDEPADIHLPGLADAVNPGDGLATPGTIRGDYALESGTTPCMVPACLRQPAGNQDRLPGARYPFRACR
jgi:hypothetical protein